MVSQPASPPLRTHGSLWVKLKKQYRYHLDGFLNKGIYIFLASYLVLSWGTIHMEGYDVIVKYSRNYSIGHICWWFYHGLEITVITQEVVRTKDSFLQAVLQTKMFICKCDILVNPEDPIFLFFLYYQCISYTIIKPVSGDVIPLCVFEIWTFKITATSPRGQLVNEQRKTYLDRHVNVNIVRPGATVEV